jgi:hypothetical protein
VRNRVKREFHGRRKKVVVASKEYARFGVRVAGSSIGRGVFALQSFGPHETIGRMTGRTFCDPDYGSDYCVDLGDDLSLEPAAPFRYLNHSCQPNCVLINVRAWNARRRTMERQIWVQSLQPIALGDELTIDYGWPAEAAIPCTCGSRRCRGWIVAKNQRDRLPDGRPRGRC